MMMADTVEKGALLACWSCRGPVAAREPFCPTCGAVQPPGALDPFARLGLAPGFEIDPAALDRHYFDLQRRLHPDRFVAKSARERAHAQRQAAALNQAYETLKEPLSRAGALLRLAGREVAFDGEGTIADPALLTEAMTLREALAEAADESEARNVASHAGAELDACRRSLAAAFAADDLDAAGRLAMRLRYLIKLAEEARSRIRALA